MNMDYLAFEQPIIELEEKIDELCRVESGQQVDLTEEIARLRKKSQKLTESIFSNLSTEQIVQLARHPKRPYTNDYIEHIFTDFDELHGDRHFSDGSAIVGGLARFKGRPVMVLGHQKGRTTKAKLARNFGMPQPESFRKALRLMKLAERFKLPLITFIDTPGAYPGIGAEERNQSEAIARNLLEMSRLKTPIICVVIGEGCSGGALGIGVGDRIVMLEYSYYSVISPEGCASILWKNAEKASEAAEAMGVTAPRLKDLGLIEQIVPEPLGGAHRDVKLVAAAVQQSIAENLVYLQRLSTDELSAQRYKRWIGIGRDE